MSRLILFAFVAAATLQFLQPSAAHAACERIARDATGASRSIALTNAREALLGLQSSKFAGGTCKPMALKCAHESNGWRCTARRDCCTAGTQFIDSGIDRSGARRCKTLSGYIQTAATRESAREKAKERFLSEKIEFADSVGVRSYELACEGKLDLRCLKKPNNNYTCTATQKCCNR